MTSEEIAAIRAENESLKERLSASDRAVTQAKESQAGSDREVARLKRELAEASGEKTSAAELLAEKERLLDRRERVFNTAVERGVDPKSALSLLGLDDADDEARFEALDTIVQAERDRILKANGRKPHENIRLGAGGDMTLEQINELPDDQIRQLPAEVMNKAWEVAEQESRTRRTGKPSTLRARLAGVFGGKS